MILPHTHSRRQPAILLLYQLTDCMPFFITMQKRKAEKRLVRLIFRTIHHLLVTIHPHNQTDILTHVESHGYYPILFELLLGTSTNCSNVILYGFLDPLWNMGSNNNIRINSAPYAILEDVCRLVLQPPYQSKERDAAKRRKSNNNKNRGEDINQHSNSLLVTPPPQQNLHVHSMVTPTPKLNSKNMTTKKRSHEAEYATITRSLNPSSLRSSLEDVFSVAFHYCSLLSSWKDGEERTIYYYLSHEKDVMFELSRALRILMIGGRRNSLPPIGFKSFILEAIDKLFAACATCASTLSWACSNSHQSSDKEQQQDDKTFKRILTSLIHAVFTAKHIGLLSTGGSSSSSSSSNNNNPTTMEQSKSPDAYATTTANINKNIGWIMYVAVDAWRKRWNIGLVETSSYLLNSMEELSCESMEQSRFLTSMREDTSTNSKLMPSRFCNKTCYYVSAAFGVRRPPQDCLCGLITTKKTLYKQGLAVLLLEGCLPLQARCVYITFLRLQSFSTSIDSSTNKPISVSFCF